MSTKDFEFNQLQEISIKQFNDLNIPIYGTYENPLFKAKDIGELLGIKNIKDTINGMDENYKLLIKASVGNTDRCLEQLFLTERGLYKVLMISRKPIAKQFQDWVYDVIIEIRKTGEYKLQRKVENEIKSTTLIENYLNKSVVYIGTVKEMENGNGNNNNNNSKIVKYGITRCVKDTLDRHRKSYGDQFYFNYMIECAYKDVVERRLQTHNDLVSRHVREFDGKKCNELLRLDKHFTIDNLITIIKTLQESMESRYDREIELEREKTKQMQINLELKRMEFELKKIELQMLYKHPVQTQPPILTPNIINQNVTNIDNNDNVTNVDDNDNNNVYTTDGNLGNITIYEEFINTCTRYSPNPSDKISMETLYSSFCNWIIIKDPNFPIMYRCDFTKSIRKTNGINYKASLKINNLKTSGITNRVFY